MAVSICGLAPLLQVFDMPTYLKFYRDVLGCEIVEPLGQGDEMAWVLLRLNQIDLMLNTAYEKHHRPPAPDPARQAAHRDTTIYFGCSDVDGVYRHLLAKGIQVKEPQVAPYGMRQLYVRDPDGYGLCFQWPATPEACNKWRAWYGMEFPALEPIPSAASRVADDSGYSGT